MKILHPKTKTPIYSTILPGTLAAVLALTFDINHLVDMLNIGTLTAYTIVAVCVLILRYDSPSKSRTESQASLTRVLVMMSTFNGSSETTKLTAWIVRTCVTIYCILAAVVAILLLFDEEGIVDIAAIIVATCMLFVVFIIFCQPKNKVDDLYFRVPLVPWIPCITIFVNIYLMSKLHYVTWVRFVVWMIVGYIIYFTYGIKHAARQSSGGKVEEEIELRGRGSSKIEINRMAIDDGKALEATTKS
jgi:solute carrier family 7 (cationic amino acid transporter), member 3